LSKKKQKNISIYFGGCSATKIWRLKGSTLARIVSNAIQCHLYDFFYMYYLISLFRYRCFVNIDVL